MAKRYICANRFGAARRMVWESLEPGAKCIAGETGYAGAGAEMTEPEREAFKAMERDGRKTAFLSGRTLSIEES